MTPAIEQINNSTGSWTAINGHSRPEQGPQSGNLENGSPLKTAGMTAQYARDNIPRSTISNQRSAILTPGQIVLFTAVASAAAIGTYALTRNIGMSRFALAGALALAGCMTMRTTINICQDYDGDGYTDASCDGEGDTRFQDSGVIGGGDCDDFDESIHPDAEEICDGYDNDCDEEVDEYASDDNLYYEDSDGDGYGNSEETTFSCELPDGYADNEEDCNDGNANSYPGAFEECDGIDNDCDGATDNNCNDLGDELTVNCDENSFSTIQEAVDEVISLGTDQDIYICSGTYDENVSASLNETTLRFYGESGATLTGDFDISAMNADVLFNGFEFNGGASIEDTGADGVLTISNCIFDNMTSAPMIYFLNDRGTVSISDTTISNNNFRSSSYGGINFSLGDYLSLDNVAIEDNLGYIAILGLWDGYATITNSSVKGNTIDIESGAVRLGNSADYFRSTNTEWDGNSPADVYVNSGDYSYTAGSETDFYCSTSSGICE